MKVMFNKEKTELTLLCNDGCDSGIHFIIDKDLYEQWMGGLFTKVIL